jgi:ABC-2 type transport system permease protein
MTVRQIQRLTASELRLMWRNRLVATVALVLPLGMGAWLALGGNADDAKGWAVIGALQILLMLLLTVYATATTAIAARRQQLVLKRLRSGEIPDGAILAGLLAPVLLVALVQTVLLLAMAVAAGATMPSTPLLLVPAVVLGALMCAAAALATTRWTTSAEMAQVTTMPFFFGAIAGGIWVLTSDDPGVLGLLAPGGALADLVREAWTGGGEFGVVPALGALVLWILVGAALAGSGFRWEPRT